MKELLTEAAQARKAGRFEDTELAARLDAAVAAMKERRARMRELERKLRHQDED